MEATQVTDREAAAPLGGLVVVELASVLAGPAVGQFLAELGATVLKVENASAGGDVTRRWRLPPEGTEDDRSSYFACCNWGKQSVALDLRAPEGRALLHGLVRRCDVVLASFKPGDAERLEADAATLRRLNPRLVYAHLTGYGTGDPRPGYDAVIQAESGFTGLNGEAEGPPLKLPVALMDLLAAHQLKEALLVALLRRAQTGEGATLSVSLFGSAVSALANQATAWLAAGVVPRRMGSAHPAIAPYGTLYPAAGGDVVLAVGTDRQFAALCGLLGLDALPSDPRFADNAARVRHRDALDAALRARTATWPRAALLAALAARHVPAGAVQDVPEVFAHPAAAALVLAAAGAPTGLRQAAFTLDGAPPPAALSPPPHYGEHTAAVLSGYLDLPDDALRALAARGVVVQREGDPPGG